MFKDVASIVKEIRDAQDQVRAAMDDGDEKLAIKLGGRVDLLNEELDQIINEQNNAKPVNPVQVQNTTPFRPTNAGQAFLGPRAEFKPLPIGREEKIVKKIRLTDEAIDPLPLPSETDTTIPLTWLQPMGFLETLPKATTKSRIIEYFTADEDNELIAEIWERRAGNDKKEQSLAYDSEQTKLQTVAHWIAVLNPALEDYGQLNQAINHELRLGYERRIGLMAINGQAPYSDGVCGVLHNPKVQTYSIKSGENVVDSIRRMIDISMYATGMPPTHVCMHPDVKQNLDLLKDNNGRYMELTSGNALWTLPIVIDTNCGTTANPKVFVYNSNASTWYTNESMTITTGTIDRQFVQNTTTILCEGSHGLVTKFPKSYVVLDVPAARAADPLSTAKK